MIASDDSKLPHLFAALAAAQGEFLPIVKNQTAKITPRSDARNTTPYTFEYADLSVILQATRPALHAHGLAVTQPVNDEGDDHLLYTILTHTEGAAIVSRVKIVPPRELDIKIYGQQLAYLRRYHYNAMLNLAADDDSDSDGRDVRDEDQRFVDDSPRKTPAAKKPAAKKPANTEASGDPVQPAGSALPGQIKWVEQKTKALGLESEVIEKMLERHGIAKLASMTKEQFDSLRVELLKF